MRYFIAFLICATVIFSLLQPGTFIIQWLVDNQPTKGLYKAPFFLLILLSGYAIGLGITYIASWIARLILGAKK